MSLVLTSALWVTEFFFVKVVWMWTHWSTFHYSFLVFPLIPLVQSVLLWSYWNGYSWVRYLQLIVCSLTAIKSLTRLPALLHLTTHVRGGELRNAFDLCVNLYFVVWLSSSEARHYFSTEARHERQSLASYEEWQRRQGEPSMANPTTKM
jgi:glucose-6-phosphate-specific signal transduction histidine kinase